MLGIDVSKDTLAATLLARDTRPVQWERTVPNTPAGVAQLLARTPATVPWVLEPTGRYSHTVAQQAQAARRRVLLAPPKRAKAFLVSVQDRAKTDRLDSRGLALYALSVSLPPYPVKRAATEQLDQLLAARRGLAQALMRLGQQATDLPHAAAAIRPALGALRTQQQEIDRQIRHLTADAAAFPMVAELNRVPGIGPVTAATVTSCLQAKAFAHPDAFVAYIGLDVHVRDSGQRTGRRRLSKQGDAELRRLFYLCAQASLRSTNSPFAVQYARERAKGLPSTAALCAVARKLARLCWSMVRHQTPFDPHRVYAQPHSFHPS